MLRKPVTHERCHTQWCGNRELVVFRFVIRKTENRKSRNYRKVEKAVEYLSTSHVINIEASPEDLNGVNRQMAIDWGQVILVKNTRGLKP